MFHDVRLPKDEESTSFMVFSLMKGFTTMDRSKLFNFRWVIFSLFSNLTVINMHTESYSTCGTLGAYRVLPYRVPKTST